MRRLLLMFVSCLVLVGSVSAAARETLPEATQKARFNQGLKQAQGGDLNAAIDTWNQLLPRSTGKIRTNVHYNLAAAYEHKKMKAQAWYHLNAYIDLSGKSDAGAITERDRLAKELSDTHAKVQVQCTPMGAEATFQAGIEMTLDCPFDWWFPVGSSRVQLQKEGFVTKAYTIKVEHPAKTLNASLKLDAVPGDVTTTPPDETEPIKKPETVERKSLWVEWTIFGSGVAIAATGGVLNILAASRAQELNDDYPPVPNNPTQNLKNQKDYNDAFESDVNPKLWGAYALYGIGAAAAITGATLLILNSSKGPEEAAGFQFLPMVSPEGNGLAFELRF